MEPLRDPAELAVPRDEISDDEFAEFREAITGAKPTCSTCGHHTSAVLADTCTAMVPWDTGDDWGVVYCGCRCMDDPVVKAWLALGREAV